MTGIDGLVKQALVMGDVTATLVFMWAGFQAMFGQRTKAIDFAISATFGYLLIRKAHLIVGILSKI